MTNRTALIALRDAVVEGKWDHSPAGVARQVFPYRSASIDDLGLTAVEAFNGSVDAAAELTEAMLPGWSFEVRKSGFGNAQAAVWNPNVSPGRDIRVDHKTCPARALLIATLNAMIEGGADDTCSHSR